MTIMHFSSMIIAITFFFATRSYCCYLPSLRICRFARTRAMRLFPPPPTTPGSSCGGDGYISSSKLQGSPEPSDDSTASSLWQSINAITLMTNNMKESCSFYEKLGLQCSFGGPNSAFSSYCVSGDHNNAKDRLHVNIQLDQRYRTVKNWGRCIFYVSDVDAIYKRATDAGLQPEFAPTDADWGERYFHILDVSERNPPEEERCAKHNGLQK